MPLIETRCARFALFGWNVGRKMKLLMINSLHLEAGWEAKMSFWEWATSEDVNLGLHW